MNRSQLKSLIKGTLAVTPTPFDDNYQLDIGKIREITQWWIEQGLGTTNSPLKITAGGGECHNLTEEEWLQVLKTTVDAAGSGAIVMCGLKSKSTIHTIEDAKKAQDVGIIGLQIELPFYHHPNQDDYVRYFTDISDSIDIGIMIYNTHFYSAPSIKAETMLRLTDAEHVVAIKWNTPPDEDFNQMTKFSHEFNVINNGGDMIQFHKNGGKGTQSSIAAAYPQYSLNLWKLLEAKQYEKAKIELEKDTILNNWRKKSALISGGNRHNKAYMAAVGKYIGQPRLPTLPIEDHEIKELREIFKSFGWISDQN